ncbi:hypothetical protein B0H15DRAFT_790325 [Mycena belliarum]|uniref:Methyltransferase domain-containing protein n=1 Tax=Mycena belliarum TaxID=1033014 RepID=A0AAD6TR89_9AGAR|nr:hypothetical protein B0H15DRAFT_790325 [Mycena belliae]
MLKSDQYYVLDAEDLASLRTQTGIQDEGVLKTHTFAVQQKAYKIYPYPCIRMFAFIKLQITRNPAYGHVLELGRAVPGALLLDIGCAFGNDVRKISSDGFPAQNIIATDLRQEFWELGHELFRSTHASFPATFIAGDAFDPDFLSPQAPLAEMPDLHTLKSLNPLHGRLSAIHCASFFHLFSEAQQLDLAKKLAGLLSPHAGSTIFGNHGAYPEKKIIEPDSEGWEMFCHSPESWREMWDGPGGVFERGSVEVQTDLRNMGPVFDDGVDFYMMFWSVKRL